MAAGVSKYGVNMPSKHREQLTLARHAVYAGQPAVVVLGGDGVAGAVAGRVTVATAVAALTVTVRRVTSREAVSAAAAWLEIQSTHTNVDAAAIVFHGQRRWSQIMTQRTSTHAINRRRSDNTA